LTDIFLSYNREDQARAKLFAEAFEAQGFSVWWDVGLRTGEAYDEVTETALRTAKAVVVLWSKKSVQSRWVRAEATLADRNKTLVPCMIEPCERPIMFELTQTAELSHWQGDAGDRAWLAFLSDVHRFVGRQAAPVAIKETLREIEAEPAKPPETLLAVLPFDNLSSDAEMQFFSDGVSEDILGRIQRGSKLKVIGRTSSFQFRGADKPRAAQALKATHVVDGSIRRGGNKVRIAAHLTEVATQTTLWSDRYDRDLEDIFAVQDEISEAIAQALDTAFTAAKTQKIDPALYDLYLRARAPADNQIYFAVEAIATMETITRLAPGFAPAWGGLAFMRAAECLRMPYAQRATSRATIEEAIARCRVNEPDSADVLAAEFFLLPPFGDFLRQEAVVQRYRDNEASGAASTVIAGFLESVGRGREAIAECQRRMRLDALSPASFSMLGLVQWRSGDHEAGKTAMNETLEKWPGANDVSVMLIIAATVEGDWSLVDRLTDPILLARYPLGEFQGVLAFPEAARNPTPENSAVWVEHIRRFVDKTGHLPDLFTVVLAAWFGFADEIYALIERAKLGPSGGPRDQLGYLAYRPSALFVKAIPRLRADPRFVKLCARLGLVEYWLVTEKWPDCVSEVAYDFRVECEKYRDHPKDVFFA